MSPRLPRCVVPGCPVRYKSGEDRPCTHHSSDDASLHGRMRELGIDTTPHQWADDSGSIIRPH